MKISIIIASYNYELFLSRAINSILSQTYTDWEIVIIDDGSNDNSVNLIKQYAEKYNNIRFFQHSNNENKGLKETVKLGIEKSTGEYIAFLECDDYWENNYLDEKLKVLKKHPEINFIFNDVNLFGDDTSISKMNEHFNQAYKILNKKSWPRNILVYYLSINLVPTFSAVMIKKDVLKQCDYNPPIDALLDIWLWTQISLKHKFYYIDKKLTNWMQHPSSYLKTSNDMLNKETQKNFYKELFKSLKNKTKSFSINYIKLSLCELFIIPRINKIFRGMIRNILS